MFNGFMAIVVRFPTQKHGDKLRISDQCETKGGIMNKVTFLSVLLCLAANVLQLEAVSSALKRQSLIFYEPPVENNLERADQVTEHYIEQRLDNFNHQDSRTFQMVLIGNFDLKKQKS